MIKSKKEMDSKIVLDLTGAEGNAYVILTVAKELCRQLHMDFNIIREKMTSGDYENLIMVFEEYFGDFVIMYR